MDQPPRSSDGLDRRRKRILFRARHRGMHELDIILGRFADARIADLTASELDTFEGLLAAAEPDLYDWLMGAATPPPGAAAALVTEIGAFRLKHDR